MYGAQNGSSQNSYDSQLDGTGYMVNINSFGGQPVGFDGADQHIPVAMNLPLVANFAAEEASQSIGDCSVWVSMPNSSASEAFSCFSSTHPLFVSPGPHTSAYASPADTQPQPINNTLLNNRMMSSGTRPFRPSERQFDEGPTPVFKTKPFKDSHHNKAHYNNPNFEPEQWTPESYVKGQQNLNFRAPENAEVGQIRGWEPGDGDTDADATSKRSYS